jgi:hypothetical protein
MQLKLKCFHHIILRKLSCSKPTSLPSSPVEGKNQIMRTASNPVFVPMRKEPPNYDDAVKNLANKVRSYQEDCKQKIAKTTNLAKKVHSSQENGLKKKKVRLTKYILLNQENWGEKSLDNKAHSNEENVTNIEWNLLKLTFLFGDKSCECLKMCIPYFQGQNLSLVDNKCATKTSVKSQAMDDVLEILIRNGGMLKLTVCGLKFSNVREENQTSLICTYSYPQTQLVAMGM